MDLQYCHQSLLMKRLRQKGCSDIPFAVNRRNPIKQDILSLTVCKNKNATPLSFALIGEYSKQLIINTDK